jgi:hypothetical protein
MAAMEKKRVEMKTRRVETGWFYAAPAVLNRLIIRVHRVRRFFFDIIPEFLCPQ